MEEKLNMEIRYFHGKTTDKVRFTVAGIIERDTCRMGMAICGKLDNFCKAKGRAIATTRLLSEKNPKNIGRISVTTEEMEIEQHFFEINPAKAFFLMASQFNGETKKALEKIFNLYNHKPEIPF